MNWGDTPYAIEINPPTTNDWLRAALSRARRTNGEEDKAAALAIFIRQWCSDEMRRAA